jgi:hypothetical protein
MCVVLFLCDVREIGFVWVLYFEADLMAVGYEAGVDCLMRFDVLVVLIV